MSDDHFKVIIEEISKSFTENTLVKLVLSNKRNKNEQLNSVQIKKVTLKKGPHLSFVYKYPTQEMTKNYSLDESLQTLKEVIDENFYQIDLFTTQSDFHLSYFKNGKSALKKKQPNTTRKPNNMHDRSKTRLIETKGNLYLKALGVTTDDWAVKKTMQDKYRQINKYIEIIEGVVKNANLEAEYHVVDMGSGKGYLTFSLFDYLTNKLKNKPVVTGVELRKGLVEQSNAIAADAGFEKLKFIQGEIKETKIPDADVLIALHACDTATDDAIYAGIKNDAKVIICAPCCHKQVRKQLSPQDDLSAITDHGILKERQSELLTDGIRALVLEAYGYKTKVFEFIATEHTPKNIMIVGTKKAKQDGPNVNILKKIESIKSIHGLEYQYLEKLLRESESGADK